MNACRHWLEVKHGKSTTLATRRRAAVNTLAQQAFARLQYEKFETHKRQELRRGQRVQTRNLQGGYHHERTTYLQSGKQTAFSGSTATALIRNAPSIGITNPPDFGNMSTEQFKTLIRTHAPDMLMETEVAFFGKQQRIQRLIVPTGGRLYKEANVRFDTQGREWAYVIDDYGNLFSTNQHTEDRNLRRNQRFNHSSLSAGKGVISAGILKASNGHLSYIDNASGHYKPTRNNLVTALRSLEADDCDFSRHLCEVRIMEVVRGALQWSIYDDAQTLLSNENALPDRVG